MLACPCFLSVAVAAISACHSRCCANTARRLAINPGLKLSALARAFRRRWSVQPFDLEQGKPHAVQRTQYSHQRGLVEHLPCQRRDRLLTCRVFHGDRHISQPVGPTRGSTGPERESDSGWADRRANVWYLSSLWHPSSRRHAWTMDYSIQRSSRGTPAPKVVLRV